MSYVKDALLGADPNKKLREESKHLVDKWDKTGLLEGLDQDFERSGMAIMLENQAKQLIQEANGTSTGANSEEWSGVALPLVRRIFAEISAQDFVSVQPMNLPSGLIFYLDFKYGTNKLSSNPNSTEGFGGTSFYGETGPKSPFAGRDSSTASPYPEGGLYGAGRYGYTQTGSVAQLHNVTSSQAVTLADLNYDSDFSASYAGKLLKLTVGPSGLDDGASGFVRPDNTTVRSWYLDDSAGATITGSGGNLNQFSQFTNSGSDGTLSFIIRGNDSAGAGDLGHVYYNGLDTLHMNFVQENLDYNRGDFEDKSPGAYSNEAGALTIPEVNLELKSDTIVAKTRKLKAIWTPELAQDLNAYHSVDAEAELTSMLSEYISMEIDLEILDMLYNEAVTKEYWSAKVGYEWDGSSAFDAGIHATNALAYTKASWYETLGQKIQKVSNKIHQLTLRGGANFIVCSPQVATILESIPGYAAATDGTNAEFAMGVRQVGSLQNRFTVYKNPYITENQILLGFRGSNFLETGAVYAPYVPLIMTPLVYDPDNFTPRKGVMTRYAKKVVRPEFYGKIYVHGLESV